MAKNIATIQWDEDELTKFGISESELEKLIHYLEMSSKLLTKMRLTLYSGEGGAHIIHHDHPHHNDIDGPDYTAVIATISGPFDGGGW